LQLGRVKVVAPMDGQVVNLAVQEGQSLNAFSSSPVLLTLAQMRTVTVKARVPEAEIGQVRVGQAVHFTTLARGAKRREGRVQLVQPMPERLGNALYYNVLFDVDNTDGELLNDMTVRVEIVVAEAHRVPVVPVAALGASDAAGRYTVQVVDAAGKTSSRSVRVGLSDDARVQVLEGLQVGERLLSGMATPGDNTNPLAKLGL
jgi:macrolide-specific efflux system membrane fusion protein